MKKKPDRILISSLLMTVLCVAALALIATLPGGGWWFGAQVQNVNSTSTAAVTFKVYDFATGTYQRSDNLAPGSSRTYLPTDFPVPDNFQGSSIVSSNQDIRAIVNLTNRSSGFLGDPNSPSPAAGQYQGTINTSAGTTLRFPLVVNDYYSKTVTIIVQNVGTVATTAYATFSFIGSPHTNYYYNTSISPGQIAVFDPINARYVDVYNNEYHPPTGNISSAVGSLTVTASQNLAGIALEHLIQEDHATVLQATRGFSNGDGDSTLWAPINKYFYYNRFTGLQVQNVGSSSVDIAVTYTYVQDSQCNQIGTKPVQAPGVLPGYSATFPSNVLVPGCFAPAKIVATGNNPKIVALVNEAFTGYFMTTHPGHAREDTAYAAIPNSSATTKLSVPLFKEDSYSKSTGLSIQNVGTARATNVVITLKGPTGTYVSNPLSIDLNSAYVATDLRLKPPSFWNGTPLTPTVLGCQDTINGCGANGVFSVIVTSDQKIVGVANESTYPVTAPRINQDKSNYEAFNLTP
jgi:hypothetical protein